jgi:hypothetical protein
MRVGLQVKSSSQLAENGCEHGGQKMEPGLAAIDKRQAMLMESETTQLAPGHAMQIALPAQLK